MPVPTVTWEGGLDGRLRIIDQTLLPGEMRIVTCDSAESVWDAIKQLKVRGAPAIGVAAAMGVVVGVRDVPADAPEAEMLAKLEKVTDYLATSRPTAVNLFWALDRMKALAASMRGQGTALILDALCREAKAVRDEDAAMCRAIGRHGAALVPDGGGVLTHCNAGGLATADYGTALAVLYRAHEQGKHFAVYADETRPLLQGSRLTVWELMQNGIDVTLICDNMAAQVMKEGRVQMVVVGADRIAANGDTANKIGTYGVAILAREHGVPFYVAAPSSTFDLSLPDGTGIPIEQRSDNEVADGFGRRTAPVGCKVYNPAFDVTPARYIAGIITERGVITEPTPGRVAEHFGA
ncbi:MAG: S-methyl-5-thioribose-1-phosphate isomerase [Rhodospirillales bacterium]|jgi:methylthioribose-1-phosphate isomerase|nr:S-methyl-5-thioribose-1-phosphate isomerase [Rhodospirillales bacterium]